MSEGYSDQQKPTGSVENMPEVTSWQYGDYMLIGQGDEKYALTSDEVDLGDYVGQSVEVTGEFIEGYPVDGGPEYLRVSELTEL